MKVYFTGYVISLCAMAVADMFHQYKKTGSAEWPSFAINCAIIWPIGVLIWAYVTYYSGKYR